MIDFSGVLKEDEKVFYLENGPFGKDGVFIVVSNDPTVEERISGVLEELDVSSLILLKKEEFERFREEIERKAKRIW